MDVIAARSAALPSAQKRQIRGDAEILLATRDLAQARHAAALILAELDRAGAPQVVVVHKSKRLPPVVKLPPPPPAKRAKIKSFEELKDEALDAITDQWEPTRASLEWSLNQLEKCTVDRSRAQVRKTAAAIGKLRLFLRRCSEKHYPKKTIELDVALL